MFDCISRTVTKRILHSSAKPIPKYVSQVFRNEMEISFNGIGFLVTSIILEFEESRLINLF